jgi:hypothetical protein
VRMAFVEGTLTRTFGSTRRIVELANALLSLGHDVTIYAKNGSKPGWIPCRAPVARWEDISGSYDFALFNNSKPDELLRVRKTQARVRAFYVLGWGETRLREIEAQIKLRSGNGATGVIRSVFGDPAFVVLACSTWIGEHLRQRYRDDVYTLLGGVNRTQFKPYAKPQDGLMRIYHSGDPRNRKGTDTVTRAISGLALRRKGVLRQTYWGRRLNQKEMGRWYSEATIFADGQLWAGWNNPVLEAMACKTPVVCTDIGGVRDFAANGETALLVPAKNHKAMAAALMRLARSPTLREDLAERAYEGIAWLTWERTARELVNLVGTRL